MVPTHHTGLYIHWCTWGLGARAWGLESNSGTRTVVDCREMARGNNREEIHSTECLWRKIRQPWKQGDSLLSHVQSLSLATHQ